jgi:hypothetical protein
VNDRAPSPSMWINLHHPILIFDDTVVQSHCQSAVKIISSFGGSGRCGGRIPLKGSMASILRVWTQLNSKRGCLIWVCLSGPSEESHLTFTRGASAPDRSALSMTSSLAAPQLNAPKEGTAKPPGLPDQAANHSPGFLKPAGRDRSVSRCWRYSYHVNRSGKPAENRRPP